VPVVQNLCVYADTNKNKPIAIVIPVEPTLKALASQHGIQGDHLEELVHNEKLTHLVLKQLQDAGRKNGLGGIEIIDGLFLVSDEWTPQNVSIKVSLWLSLKLIFLLQGLTTAAQKLNRKNILDKYKKEVDKLYATVS